MKKLYTQKKFSRLAIVLISCITALSLLLYACKKPTDGIKILLDSTSLFPSPTLVKFTNADTISNGQLPASFAVAISGPGAKYVQMASGGTDFKVTSGLLSLALTKDAHASVTNPITFTVTASLTGYAPITQNITITKNDLSIYPVKVLEYAHPPVGTTVLSVENNGLTAGALTSAYALTTSKTATMNEQATITFAAGTQMQDANGVALGGTKLLSNIVQYGTGTDASMQAFPGGLNAPLAYKSDNTQIAGGVTFVTAGLLQMNLEASGVPVKKFSKPVSVSIELNSNMVNFATFATIQVGDKIPVWSMNETTGQWTNELDATVVLDGNGRKAAQFSINHLSCWNLDWSYGANFGTYTTCTNTLSVTVNPSDPAFKGGPYEITLQTPSGQYLGALHSATISQGFVATFPSVPNIPLAKIVVSGGIPYARVQSNTFSPCGAGGVTVTMPVGTNNPINVNIDIKGICSGKDIVILPSATFELYQQTGGSIAQGTGIFADAGTF
ncbi:MAG: hypothetical protein ABIN91_23025 [Mucilaginibacter sp.]|uniref:hypothetical protein n=1 Tax=Mucilaginibacter sp. TaxID=1882438 RepID=UPI0032642172